MFTLLKCRVEIAVVSQLFKSNIQLFEMLVFVEAWFESYSCNFIESSRPVFFIFVQAKMVYSLLLVLTCVKLNLTLFKLTFHKLSFVSRFFKKRKEEETFVWELVWQLCLNYTVFRSLVGFLRTVNDFLNVSIDHVQSLWSLTCTPEQLHAC